MILNPLSGQDESANGVEATTPGQWEMLHLSLGLFDARQESSL